MSIAGEVGSSEERRSEERIIGSWGGGHEDAIAEDTAGIEGCEQLPRRQTISEWQTSL